MQQLLTAEALIPRNFSSHRKLVCDALTRAYEQLGSPPLVFIQIPDSTAPLAYADIKWWSDCHQGVPSVCVAFKTLGKAESRAKTAMMIRGNLA